MRPVKRRSMTLYKDPSQALDFCLAKIRVVLENRTRNDSHIHAILNEFWQAIGAKPIPVHNDTVVYELGLGEELAEQLVEAGYKTLRDLRSVDVRDLCEELRFGRHKLDRIEEVLAKCKDAPASAVQVGQPTIEELLRYELGEDEPDDDL